MRGLHHQVWKSLLVNWSWTVPNVCWPSFTVHVRLQVYRWRVCAFSVKILHIRNDRIYNFLWLLVTPKTYGFAHLRHTSSLVHWPILHNIILLPCTCIFCACTVYDRGRFLPEQKTEPIFNLGHCSWKLKQLIMKVVVDYAIGSISHHYIMSEALNSFWQRYCIWYPSITYNSVVMEVDIFWCEWPLMIFSGDLSHRSIQVYMYVLSLFICKFVSRKWGYFFQFKQQCKQKAMQVLRASKKKSPLVVQGFLV